MKVGELIRVLQSVDPDLDTVVRLDADTSAEVLAVNLGEVNDYPRCVRVLSLIWFPEDGASAIHPTYFSDLTSATAEAYQRGRYAGFMGAARLMRDAIERSTKWAGEPSGHPYNVAWIKGFREAADKAVQAIQNIVWNNFTGVEL
jgi:hypothetical protein